MIRRIATCALLAGLCAAGCGGKSDNGVVAPSETIAVADVAPVLAETVASTVTAALRTGSASTASVTPPGTVDRLVAWLGPVTVHAQTSAFVAPCARGGNVDIRYFGVRSRVALASTQVVYAGCGFVFKQRTATFSGTLTATGIWTATDPGRVSLSGTLNVDSAGPVPVDGFIGSDATFNGTLGGITVGKPDTNPPPNPDTCQADLSTTAIQAPPGGGTFPVTVTVGATCAWTASGSGFATVAPASGTGPGTVTVTVAANTGAARTVTISVAGRSVTVNQIAADAPPPTPPVPTPPSTQGNPLGRWEGTITATQPCSEGVPSYTYDWIMDIDPNPNGSGYLIGWIDDYFDTIFERVLPADTHAFTFTINDGHDSFALTGAFSDDWRSIQGSVTAQIECNNIQKTSTGSWKGSWLKGL